MSWEIAASPPLLVCCGILVVWELIHEDWFGSCYQCGRDFICSEPPPCSLSNRGPRGS